MSATIHERQLARGRRWKRRKDRRVFVERIEAHERDVVTLRPLNGGEPRVVSRFRLVQGFIEVARCPSCGWHIGVHVSHHHDIDLSVGRRAA